MTQKYTAQSIRGGKIERRKLSLKVFGQGQDKGELHLINDIYGNRELSLTHTHTHTHTGRHTHTC